MFKRLFSRHRLIVQAVVSRRTFCEASKKCWNCSVTLGNSSHQIFCLKCEAIQNVPKVVSICCAITKISYQLRAFLELLWAFWTSKEWSDRRERPNNKVQKISELYSSRQVLGQEWQGAGAEFRMELVNKQSLHNTPVAAWTGRIFAKAARRYSSWGQHNQRSWIPFRNDGT